MTPQPHQPLHQTQEKTKPKILTGIFFFFLFSVLLISCDPDQEKGIATDQLASILPGWEGKILGISTESYMGWDVEIGDANNDGRNEILVTGAPNSELNMFRLQNRKWTRTLLAKDLAQAFPGMGLAVKIVDLNGDGKNEIILGTGQEKGADLPAYLYTFRIENNRLKTVNVCHPGEVNKSAYTHNLAAWDVDHDGILEVFSAYCGGGEVLRYDFSRDLKTVHARKIHQLSGSGEGTQIADVDNDGRVELILSNGFREKAARLEIFEFGEDGELVDTPRVVLDGYDGIKCFYASFIIGDVDNDGENELIVGWKKNQKINKGTILGYKVKDKAVRKYTFAREEEALDMSYFEKMMVVADADNDGRNELVVSTRGDNLSEFIQSRHLGHIFMYSIRPDGHINTQLIVDLNDTYAGSSWIDAGDADNDGRNEIVIATGQGDRTKPGRSYLLMVKKR